MIEEALVARQNAIMLVPEISDSSGDRSLYFALCNKVVASGLSDGEKYDEWRKVERGRSSGQAVGASSGHLAPWTKHLSLILTRSVSWPARIPPRYHAREVVLLRARYNQAVLVLGSRPAWERAGAGVYDFLQLTKG